MGAASGINLGNVGGDVSLYAGGDIVAGNNTVIKVDCESARQSALSDRLSRWTRLAPQTTFVKVWGF